MPICFIICFIFRGFIPPPPNIGGGALRAFKSVAKPGARPPGTIFSERHGEKFRKFAPASDAEVFTVCAWKLQAMSGLLPSDTDSRREEPSTRDGSGDLRVLWLDDEDAEQLIGSLSSQTARAVLTELHEGQATASELSDRVDTSLQNVRHHLTNLQEAGLVKVADTRYSVKGREMSVYAPADDSLVVCVGREDDRSSFLDSLKRLVSVVALLGIASALVQYAFGAGVVDLGGPGTAPRVGDAVGAADPLFGLLPPGVAFFAGGLLVLAALAAWEYGRRRTADAA
jgi:DNA-binding transcriptional ArsR family regulator